MCTMCIASSAAWLYNLVRFIVVNRIIREAAILTSQHNNLIEQFSGSRCICQYIIPLILHHWPFTLDPLANFFCLNVLMEGNMDVLAMILSSYELIFFYVYVQEVQRIKREHPDDDQCIVNDRVKGRLKVTRAFGAGYLKQVIGTAGY